MAKQNVLHSVGRPQQDMGSVLTVLGEGPPADEARPGMGPGEGDQRLDGPGAHLGVGVQQHEVLAPRL